MTPFRYRDMFLYIVSVLTLAVAGCASGSGGSSASTGSSESDHMIVAGERIGALRLGMSYLDAQNILGRPNNAAHNEKISLYSWWPANGLMSRDPTKDVEVYALAGYDWTKVMAVVVFDPAYRTAEGLGVGSTLEEIKARLGPPSAIEEGYGGGLKKTVEKAFYRNGTLVFDFHIANNVGLTETLKHAGALRDTVQSVAVKYPQFKLWPR